MSILQLSAALFNLISGGIFAFIHIRRRSLYGMQRFVGIILYAVIFLTLLALISSSMIFVYSKLGEIISSSANEFAIPLWLVATIVGALWASLFYWLISLMRLVKANHLFMAYLLIVLSATFAVAFPTTFETPIVQFPSISGSAPEMEGAGPSVSPGQDTSEGEIETQPRPSCASPDRGTTREQELALIRECSIANNYYAFVTTLMTVIGSIIAAFISRTK